MPLQNGGAEEQRGTCDQRPQITEERGVNALNALPSWEFGYLGQLGKSTDGDLEESCWEES